VPALRGEGVAEPEQDEDLEQCPVRGGGESLLFDRVPYRVRVTAVDQSVVGVPGVEERLVPAGEPRVPERLDVAGGRG